MNKIKRFLIRNLVWNKTYQSKDYQKEAEILIRKLKEDGRIQYCIFSIERGSYQSEDSFHFQGYTEFKNKVDANAFNREFKFNDIQDRRGSQQQSIDYVKKERSKIDDKIYEFGIPKNFKARAKVDTYNKSDLEIPGDLKGQEVKINQRLKDNYYAEFEDIEKDFMHIFIKQKNWLKNLWNEYHPIKKLDIQPAKVIWLWGEKGSGKSTWTKRYLRSFLQYKDEDVAIISPQNLTNYDKVYFDLAYEKCKVLVLNEVDKSFPKYNNLISFIDRNTLLVTKGSHVRNNFDLIIINSIYRPEFVFSYLGRDVASQVIRRIYNKAFDCCVYHIFPNKKQQLLVENGNISFPSDAHFQDWYQPIIKKIEEPNYSLIPEFVNDELKQKLIEKKKESSSFFSKFKSMFFHLDSG